MIQADSAIQVEPGESAEFDFVRACLAHLLDPEQPLPEAVQLLDWDDFYALLVHHELAGVFYQLGKGFPALWPERLQVRLRGLYARAQARGCLCQQQVALVLPALQQAGIAMIVLKGWALIPAVYGGDHGQRSYFDIDLLVHPRDAARAERVVQGLGYRAKLEPRPGFDRRFYSSRAYSLPGDLAPFGLDFAIGLHWQLLSTPFYFRYIGVEALFERARPLAVEGIDVAGLSVEDAVVYASGHLALHHRYDPALYRYYELAALILQAGRTVDWDMVVSRAADWRLVLPVQYVLARLASLWPEVVPTQILKEVLALQPTAGERFVHYWLVRAKENYSVRALLAWLTMPGAARRWLYLVEKTFPGSTYMQWRYGPAPLGIWPWLYVRRLGRALGYLGRLRSPPGSPSGIGSGRAQ